MRRAFNKAMAILNAILATTGGVDPKTGEKRKPIKDRFVEGDHFYMGIRHKRVAGKWKVRGPHHSKYQILRYLTMEEHKAELLAKKQIS